MGQYQRGVEAGGFESGGVGLITFSDIFLLIPVF